MASVAEQIHEGIQSHEANCPGRKSRSIPMGIQVTIYIAILGLILTGFGIFQYADNANASATAAIANENASIKKEVEIRGEDQKEIRQDVKQILKTVSAIEAGLRKENKP